MANKPKLGSGKRFEELTNKLREHAKNPRALAAYIGMKKYGKAKMESMAHKGRSK